VNGVAISSDRFGLKEGAAILFKLEESLMRKRHTLNFDVNEVARSLMVLGSYVSLLNGNMKEI
jgi:uncharacterized protein YfeS